jgi:muramoyltetrapeptide carboxypeptidase
MNSLMTPLPAGSCLGVIAPAGPPKPGVLAQVVPAIEMLGFRAQLFAACDGPPRHGYLAADDATRLAGLHAALADPGVDALLALRGGYGCLRLLPQLDRALIRRAGKLLIGYSDLTTLHGVWANEGVPSWHAPMPASDWLQPGGQADAALLAQRLRQGVRSGDTQQAPAAHPLNRPGIAQGRLLGGNLAVFTAAVGTTAMPDVRGAILFFEDISEEPYRVDRYLAQLGAAGVLGAAAGFLLGSFTEAASCDAILADHLHALGKPVLAGWPAGHGQPNHALPLGLAVRLDAAARTLRW